MGQALELDLWSGVSLLTALRAGLQPARDVPCLLPVPVPASSQLPKLAQSLPCLTRLTCDCRDFVLVTLSVLLMQGAVSVAQRVY